MMHNGRVEELRQLDRVQVYCRGCLAKYQCFCGKDVRDKRKNLKKASKKK